MADRHIYLIRPTLYRVSKHFCSATSNLGIRNPYQKRPREHALRIWGHVCILPGCQCSTLIIGSYMPPAITLARQSDPFTDRAADFTIGEVYCSSATEEWDRGPWFVSMDPATGQLQLCCDWQSAPSTIKKLFEERIIGKAKTTIE